MNEAGAPAVARFMRGTGVVGGGALLPGGLVLTCAHVVNAALGRPVGVAERPGDAMLVDFPLHGISASSARVVAWSPYVALGEGDVAVVALEGGPLSAIEPLPLIERAVPADELLALFGFPHKRPAGVWKRELRVAGPLVGGWQQLLGRGDRDYKLQPGFSGCPIIDAGGRVVGVFAQAEEAPEVDAGAAIPVSVSASLLQASEGFVLTIWDGGRDVSVREDVVAGVVGLPEVWNVPPLRNASFTGRGGELAALSDALRTHRAVVLTGLGGVGKSQLAVQHAYDGARGYRLVWWVAADRSETLVGDLAALARRLGVSEAEAGNQQAAAEAALRQLERQEGWLLVFDNAADPQLVRPWLPQVDAGEVLITSRYAAWGATAHPMHLSSLAIEDAAQLVQRRSGQDDREAAHALANQLGGLPLALEQAGAYIEATGMPLADYLALFRTRRSELLGKAADPEAPTVAATWELAFEQLREHASAAADLLTVVAFLAPDDIPRQLFAGNDALPPPLQELGDALVFADALAALARYSLATPTGDAFTVHRLVQTVTRDRLSEDKSDAWATTAIDLLDAVFPFDNDDPSTWAPTGRLLPHALEACHRSEHRQVAQEQTSRLLNQSGLYLLRHAQLGPAQTAFERALAIDEAAYGPDHPEVAIDVNNLGGVLRERGDLAGAAAAFERALAIDEAAYGPDHPEVAIRVNNLGGVLRARGDLAGAAAAFERALTIDEAAYGPDHPKVAIRVNNLGEVLRARGDLAGAAAAIERALTIDEAAYGPDHPNVAIRVNNLGLVLQARGDLAGAAAAFERALTIDEAAYGPDHPNVAIRVNNLGGVLRERGDLAGAAAAFEGALLIFEGALGAEHPSTETVRANLESVS